ncbi:uncharacterized protein EAF01_004953 [Botrytis porri]|uniref:Killer toxin Kp4 domain-containing protein n=1 Tax=Botrytis porri TaxID=87229 RepID=A0A4Z1K6E0_9HELO|nr:uncharacterized protein EAF01_004953 [Botrytis porri]KAF7907366.1 hypothetical protein EAF01_004953 [Botrytis porri]TGO81084.1 hypothetical protein BPOR_1365g00010 [Botrytis porri]
MRYSVLLVLAAGLLAEAATLDNCRGGLTYCGQGLLRKGNYYADIINSLSAAGQSTDQDHVNFSLFLCRGNDDVPFQRFCGAGRCVDGGAGRSDYCS